MRDVKLKETLIGIAIVGVIYIAVGIYFSGIGIPLFRPNPSLSALNYDAQIQKNGDMAVSETWQTNFPLNLGKWDGLTLTLPNDDEYEDWYISDVSIHDETTGKELSQVGSDNDDQWESSGKDYYTLEWSIPPVMSVHDTYTVSYVVHGDVTTGEDISFLDTKFLNLHDTMSVGKVTGTISWPGHEDSGNLRAWIHVPPTTDSPSISVRSDGSLAFSVNHLAKSSDLEMVGYAPKSAISKTELTVEKTAKSVASDENMLSEQESNDRGTKVGALVFSFIVAAAVIALAVWWGHRCRKRIQNAMINVDDIAYWREAPGISPSGAAYLLAMLEPLNAPKLREKTAFPAGILSLINQGKIVVKMAEANDPEGAAEEATFTVPDAVGGGDGLGKTENALLELLRDAQEEYGSPVRFKDLRLARSFSRDDELSVRKLQVDVERFELYANDEASQCIFIDESLRLVPMVCESLGIFFSTVILFMEGWGLWAAIVAAIGAFTIAKVNWKMPNSLPTDSGKEIVPRVLGLRDYLGDFSDFEDRDADYMALWGMYLVYATAFGLDTASLEQVPQVANPTYWEQENTSPLYEMMSSGVTIEI